MSKLKLRLNESDLRTMQGLLLLSIRANPVPYLRENPADYLIVAELTAIYNKVELKVRDLEWFGSTRSTAGKVVSLTLTRPEAIALYVMLTSEVEPDEPEDDSILPFERTTPVVADTYEIALIRQLIGLIQRTYFI